MPFNCGWLHQGAPHLHLRRRSTGHLAAGPAIRRSRPLATFYRVGASRLRQLSWATFSRHDASGRPFSRRADVPVVVDGSSSARQLFGAATEKKERSLRESLKGENGYRGARRAASLRTRPTNRHGACKAPEIMIMRTGVQ